MKLVNKHIIFIGFKHVGKSALSKCLAETLKKKLIDLDKKIESLFEKKYLRNLSCRQIMQTQGEQFFRDLETEALTNAITSEPQLITLGGGAPLCSKNQKLISSEIIIHVTAPPGVVFERIIINGPPAFLSGDEDLLMSFKHHWVNRKKIYEKLATFSVNNNSLLQISADKAMKELKLNG